MVFDISYIEAKSEIKRPALQSNFLFHILDTGESSISDASPEGFEVGGSELPKFIEGHVEEAAFEALNVETSRYNHSLQSSPFVEDLEDNSVSLTLIEDKDHDVKKFFQGWLNLIRNKDENPKSYVIDGKEVQPTNAKNTVNPPAVYQKDAEMVLFDPTSLIGEINIKATVKFKKAVPENISESDYTYEDGADKVPLNLDLAFEDYEFNFVSSSNNILGQVEEGIESVQESITDFIG